MISTCRSLQSLTRGAVYAAAFVVSSVIAIDSLTNSARAADADPISQLKPGEWYEVPDSRLDAVAAPVSKFPWLSGGIGGIVDCWAGGAFDTQRDRLYIGPGGGHAGYNGNEIYAFDLHDLKWHRLNDPDPVIPGTEYTEVEKAPFAMHTYDGVEYLPPPTDRYVVIGGWGTERTYAMNPDRPDRWEVYPDHGTGRTGDICAYDPISQLLFLSTPTTAGKFSQWDPLAHHWTLRASTSPTPSYYETADVDFKRRQMVACGRGKLKTWNLTLIPGSIAEAEVQTTGDTTALEASSPGFCYVPLIDQFVAWADGADVFTLDMDTRRWTKHPPASTNKVIPGPRAGNGTFGRFRYVPSKNVFVLYNNVKQNVFIYRLTADVPNVITGVEAKVARPKLETNLPAAAVTVQAIYADGTRKDVTQQANYFSLDPAVAGTDVHGQGKVTGIKGGTARIRAVYTDPAFKRGFASEVSLPVQDIVGEAKLEKLQASYPKLTIVSGDSFQLETTGSYARGQDHFTRSVTQQATWLSSASDVVKVSNGLVRAVGKSGSAEVSATYNGKSDVIEVTVVDAPVIQRINFQVQAAPVRDGWQADNGQPFSEARGFGWLNAKNFTTRDDRARAKHELLMRFVIGDKQDFKVKVSSGPYVVRIAMGDADYGAMPFEKWVALGDEKLLYYEGHHNSIATKHVQAGDDGLTFTVNGPINYLIVAPEGIDLDKYANDGPTGTPK